MVSPYCPEYAPFFGFLGAALALVFGNMGAAYGTWKSALGLATIAKLPRHKVQTELVMKAIMPVILSGVCGIFGLIIAVIICLAACALLVPYVRRDSGTPISCDLALAPRRADAGAVKAQRAAFGVEHGRRLSLLLSWLPFSPGFFAPFWLEGEVPSP